MGLFNEIYSCLLTHNSQKAPATLAPITDGEGDAVMSGAIVNNAVADPTVAVPNKKDGLVDGGDVFMKDATELTPAAEAPIAN